MQTKSFNSSTTIISILICVAILSRLIPHPANFAPMMSIGLFGGALFQNKKWAYIIPLLSIWLSDLYINNVVYGAYYPKFVWLYSGFYWQYSIFLLMPILGALVFNKNITATRIFATAIGSGLIFFFVSNFGVWISGHMYPKTATGLWQCYLMGLPFLKGTLASNVIYSTLLFGSYYLIEKQIPYLSKQSKFQIGWI
jgi:hypothetical protein